MGLLNSIVRGVRALRHKELAEREMDDELCGFLAASTAEKLRRGMTPEQAAHTARIEMGSSNAVKHHIRSAGWESTLEILWQDVLYSLRALIRMPGFTLVAVLSLALGIGANTAIFSLINQVLLHNLPVRDPQQLVTYGKSASGGVLGGIDLGTFDEFTYDFAHQLEAKPGPFQGVAHYSSFSPDVSVRLSHAAAALQVPVSTVSGNYFSVLGAVPLFGRTLIPSDADAPNRSAVVVLSHHFWQHSLSADPDIVGKTISLNTTPFTVVGVMPEAFHGITQTIDPPQLWVPTTMIQSIAAQAGMLEPRSFYFIHMLARRSPQSSLSTDQNWLDRQIRGYVRAGEGAKVLLARAISRQREIATRLALGSSRARIVRQSLIEALMLSFIGGVLGLAVAFAATRALIAFVAEGATNIPLDPRPDAIVLLFTFSISLFAGLLFGLAPALHAARSSAGLTLTASTRTAAGSAGRGGRVWPKVLVTAQIMLSLLLLVGAGLFLRTLRNLADQDFGFESTHLLIAQFDAHLAGYKPEQAPGLNQRLLERLSSIPGVRSAALAGSPPVSSSTWRSFITIPGYTPAPKEDMSSVLNRVTGNYFETAGISMLAGRAIGSADNATSLKVAVINQVMASKFFPKGDAVGRTLKVDVDSISGPWHIVGVARDTKSSGPREETDRMIYFPLAQVVGKNGEGIQDSFVNTILLRTTGDPATAIHDLRSAVATVDPNLPILQVHTIQEQLESFMSHEVLISRLTAIFAALALLLACIGLYGVLNYNVQRRTNEIGLRIALGATGSGVRWMVMRESLLLLVAGLVLGLPIALTSAHLLRSQLYEMSPFDPGILALAVGVIAVVTVLAAWLPARSAAAIDPTIALRCD